MIIITKVPMSEKVQKNICTHCEIGQNEYATFVEECINSEKIHIWARMKKVQLKTCTSARKVVKH